MKTKGEGSLWQIVPRLWWKPLLVVVCLVALWHAFVYRLGIGRRDGPLAIAQVAAPPALLVGVFGAAFFSDPNTLDLLPTLQPPLLPLWMSAGLSIGLLGYIASWIVLQSTKGWQLGGTETPAAESNSPDEPPSLT